MKIYCIDKGFSHFQPSFNRWIFIWVFMHVDEDGLEMMRACFEVQSNSQEKCRSWYNSGCVTWSTNQMQTKHSSPPDRCILVEWRTSWIKNRIEPYSDHLTKKNSNILPGLVRQKYFLELNVSISVHIIRISHCCKHEWWCYEASRDNN